MSYRIETTDTPPILRKRGGRWFVVIVKGDLELEAPIGPWFASEFMVRIVIPQVLPIEGPSHDQIKPPVPQGEV